MTNKKNIYDFLHFYVRFDRERPPLPFSKTLFTKLTGATFLLGSRQECTNKKVFLQFATLQILLSSGNH